MANRLSIVSSFFCLFVCVKEEETKEKERKKKKKKWSEHSPSFQLRKIRGSPFFLLYKSWLKLHCTIAVMKCMNKALGDRYGRERKR